MQKINRLLFSSIPLGKNRRIPFPVFVWFLLPLIAVFAELLHHKINNYYIYKGVFWHVLHRQNIFLQYPQEFFDSNHYGPLFSIVIAPFALLPDAVGVVLWVIFNAWFLYYAIQQLPLSQKARHIILLVSAIELMTASHNVQFNPITAAWIILSFTLVKKEKDGWATLFIALGFLIKIYGIVGLLFFLFSKHKARFAGSFVLWLVVLFCLPMLISSPAFIVQSYTDWGASLIEKNTQNTTLVGNMQDISVPGMVRRIFSLEHLQSLAILLPSGLLTCLPLLRFRLWNNVVFQLYYLALMLIGLVIFSSSAESPTYVIALCGVAVWFVLNMHRQRAANNWLLAFVLLLTCLSPTDLFPRFVRQQYIVPYSLKALPCFVVWLVIIGKVAFAKNETLHSPEVV